MLKPFRFMAALAAIATLTACGASAADRASEASKATAAAGFPVTVESCTHKLTFEKAPERVVILGSTGLATVDRLGMMDRVAAQVGDTGGVDRLVPGLADKLKKVKHLAAGNTSTGGAMASTESILSVKPDLVIGYEKGVDREQLAAAGVPLYSPEAFCPSYSVTHANWELVNKDVEQFATIFGVRDRLPGVLDDLKKQVQQIPKATKRGTAAAVYIYPGGGAFGVYGTSSMVQPIFEANGLRNVYDDQTKRVFDGSLEDLLKRNPDWIVVLSSKFPSTTEKDALVALNGAKGLKAVREGHVVVLPFPLTDPPNVLSVSGAVELAALLGKK